MTNQEYLDQHPEKFKDDIDKWIFTEFSIIGGCSSAQGSMEYSVARMVAERLFNAQGNKAYYECMAKIKKQWLDKACEWLDKHSWDYIRGDMLADKHMIKDFRKAMED